MTGVLIAGTSSDAGKSAVVTGICRALARRGVDVAPFKAQNMSNNSMVCADGAEIGRAQYLQALAAGVEPSSLLNPVLLKPGTDRRSHVIMRGRPAGTLESGEYATGRRHLAEAAFGAYRELASQHELVIVEGAGSPAEINLRGGDYVNLGLARQFKLPVVVVGDIDRGGVLASLYGTWALVDDADRSQLAGYIINKFRGDEAVLRPGLEELTARTGLENFGVLPWLSGVWLDGEDALQVDRWRGELPPTPAGQPALRVAVIRFPRISNATDVEALAHTPGVEVQVTDDPRQIAAADLLVLPGSRSTVDDLAWLRERGLAEAIAERHASARPTLGICGGYQMLAESIDDHVESASGRVRGLGLLPIEVRFSEEKITALTTHQWGGHQVAGYEIHHGVCTTTGDATPFLDGWQSGTTFGTMLHGSLENDDFRSAFLTLVAEQTGNAWRPDPTATGYAAAREQMINTLADAVEQHVDLDRLLELTAPTYAVADRDSHRFGQAQQTRREPSTEKVGAGGDWQPTARVAEGGSIQGLASGMSEDARADRPSIWRRSGNRSPLDHPSQALEAGARPRTQPLLMVYTGDGKGKTTAAMGMGLRAWAQGTSIGVYQFIKASKWPTGERAAYQALDQVQTTTGQGGPIEWHNFGAGRTGKRANRDIDQAELARAGWAVVREALTAQRHGLYILDEFSHVLAKGWVDLAEVIATLRQRPGTQHVVITGRNAPPELIEIADLVSEVAKLRHPFDEGIKGQPGVEW